MQTIKQLTCPNCGANITNTQNCEYCGSLLVRFVDKGIDLAKTSYLNNSFVSNKLLKNLQQALKMQQQADGQPVVIDIYQRKDLLGKEVCRNIGSVLRSGRACFDDDTSIPCDKTYGLCIIIGFYRWSNTAHEKFKSLDCFPLFTQRDCFDSKDGKVTEYYIDFGEDADGAHHILADIFKNVYDVSEEELECYVNVGHNNIRAFRDRFNRTNGVLDMSHQSWAESWDRFNHKGIDKNYVAKIDRVAKAQSERTKIKNIIVLFIGGLLFIAMGIGLLIFEPVDILGALVCILVGIWCIYAAIKNPFNILSW